MGIKIMKKLGLILKKITFFSILGIFIGLFNNQVFTQADFATISVDQSVSYANACVKPVLELNPTNQSYKTIESEIARIKSSKNELDLVCLDEYQSSVPVLYKTVKEIVDKFVKTAKIKTPKLLLYVGSDNSAYNASANTSTITRTTTTTKTYGRKVETVVDEKIENHYKLVLGEGLVKLLLWKNYGSKLLAAIIGHEIGHMCDNNVTPSKTAEYFADSKAVEFLGKNDSDKLIQAINMITLGSHMYNILTLNSDFLKLNLGDAHQVIRIIVNSMVNEIPDLGDLGTCSSHKKVGYVVSKVFQDALKYSLDPKIGMTEKEFMNVYEKMHKACSNLAGYMGEDEEREISQKYEFIENYTNQIYNHITHPTPLERSNNVKLCMAKLA
jgi:hypothetical protein